MNGELPTVEEFAKFEHDVTHHTMMHESLKNFLHGFRYDAPDGDARRHGRSLSAFYHDTDLDPAHRRQAVRLLAKVLTAAASLFDRLADPLPAH